MAHWALGEGWEIFIGEKIYGRGKSRSLRDFYKMPANAYPDVSNVLQTDATELKEWTEITLKNDSETFEAGIIEKVWAAPNRTPSSSPHVVSSGVTMAW